MEAAEGADYFQTTMASFGLNLVCNIGETQGLCGWKELTNQRPVLSDSDQSEDRRLSVTIISICGQFDWAHNEKLE